MKSKQNKKGAALVFTIVILSISVIVALSIAATSVISRKGASSVQKSNQAFQEADSASDAFDKVFETSASFVCDVMDYYDDDDVVPTIRKCCQGTYDANTNTCDMSGSGSENGDHMTNFGTCQSSGDGTIVHNGFQTTILGEDGPDAGSDPDVIRCDSGSDIVDVREIRTVATDGQNKRAIENVPPCAGFDPDNQEILLGKWDMDAIESGVIDDESSYDNDMQLKKVPVSDLNSVLPEIDTIAGHSGLYFNKRNAIAHNNGGNGNDGQARRGAGNGYTDPTTNTKFNFAQIPPIPEYAAQEGTVSFWFYAVDKYIDDDNDANDVRYNDVADGATGSANSYYKLYGFTPYSRDMNTCLNDFVANGDDDNGNGLFDLGDTMPVGGMDQGDASSCSNDDPPDSYNSDPLDPRRYLCDCGHMSFMWNSQYWSTYRGQFGTRFQNDENGSHFKLSSALATGDNIANNWNLVTITFGSNGAALYFNEEQKSTINNDSYNDPFLPDQDGFEGLLGNFSWTYVGMFAGSMRRDSGNINKNHNILDSSNPSYYLTNGTRYLQEEIDNGSGFGSNAESTNCNSVNNCKMLFYPFKGFVRDLRIYNRSLEECEVRRLWYETR